MDGTAEGAINKEHALTKSKQDEVDPKCEFQNVNPFSPIPFCAKLLAQLKADFKNPALGIKPRYRKLVLENHYNGWEKNCRTCLHEYGHGFAYDAQQALRSCIRLVFLPCGCGVLGTPLIALALLFDSVPFAFDTRGRREFGIVHLWHTGYWFANYCVGAKKILFNEKKMKGFGWEARVAMVLPGLLGWVMFIADMIVSLGVSFWVCAFYGFFWELGHAPIFPFNQALYYRRLEGCWAYVVGGPFRELDSQDSNDETQTDQVQEKFFFFSPLKRFSFSFGRCFILPTVTFGLALVALGLAPLVGLYIAVCLTLAFLSPEKHGFRKERLRQCFVDAKIANPGERKVLMCWPVLFYASIPFLIFLFIGGAFLLCIGCMIGVLGVVIVPLITAVLFLAGYWVLLVLWALVGGGSVGIRSVQRGEDRGRRVQFEFQTHGQIQGQIQIRLHLQSPPQDPPPRQVLRLIPKPQRPPPCAANHLRYCKKISLRPWVLRVFGARYARECNTYKKCCGSPGVACLWLPHGGVQRDLVGCAGRVRAGFRGVFAGSGGGRKGSGRKGGRGVVEGWQLWE